MTKYPYADHDKGMVLSQPRPGEFESEPMTPAQLAARDPALAIAKDIYRHANQAGVCYYEFWLIISDAIEKALAKRAEEKTTDAEKWRFFAAHATHYWEGRQLWEAMGELRLGGPEEVITEAMAFHKRVSGPHG